MDAERLKQIEEIYHAALEISPVERESFFEERCGADVNLRREIESLLSFEKPFDSFIDEPPDALAAEMLSERGKVLDRVNEQIGRYKIIKLLGAGGMGEVYLAEDTRLHRKVALKILPENFAADANRLSRFEREARAASALNHPNILTVHEFGAENGVHFLATEFIEGETLRQRIGGETILIADALDIAEQTVFALSAAHAAGIVHRDIKPENIMIRTDGIVKVLDFGIAKLAAPLTNSVDTEGETLAKPLTQTNPGMIIGTLQYMSPEQIRGQTVDARSDIFSLGVVIYEMLTGREPFNKATPGDSIAAILTEQPPSISETRSDAPAELERIVGKALRKNKDERYQTCKDLLLDIRSLRKTFEFQTNPQPTAAAEDATRRTKAQAIHTTSAITLRRFSIVHALSIFLIVGLAAGAIWWFAAGRNYQNETASSSPLNTIEVVNWRSTPGEIYSVGAFSPDGKMIAFTSTKVGAKNIWVKQISGGEAVQITKDDFTNQNPIWSPSGDEIAFFSARGGTSGIWRMPPLGGNPTFIKAIEGGAVLRRWSKSDVIYYESMNNFFALDLKIGQTNQLTNFDAATTSVNSFSISADEKQIACVAFENDRYAILTMPTQPNSRTERIFDSADEIRNAVWHADGKRILYSQTTSGAFQIFAVAAGGKPAQITFGERDAFALDASADGAKILYGASKEESDLWGVNVERGEEFAFAADINSELWASVSPDSKTVAYQSIKNLSQGDKIFNGAILVKSNGAGDSPLQLTVNAFLPAWSPDGSRLAFGRIAGESYQLWTIKAAGGEEKQLTTGSGIPSIEFTIFPYNRSQASNFNWSPDGGKIAYVADDLPHNIRAVDANDANRNIQITDNTDANLFLACPLWSADGRRLAFSSKTNKANAEGKKPFSAWIVDTETKAAKNIRQTENFQKLLGFSASGKELLLAEIKGKNPNGLPTEVTIIEINIETGEQRVAAVLTETYLYNIYLSTDKKMLAYASHQDGKDNIWIVRLAARGAARKITSNNDTRLYFSALTWSPDNRTIYFGKQTRYSLLSMVTNFK